MAGKKKTRKQDGWVEDWQLEFCEAIAGGDSLRAICKRKDMPGKQFVYDTLAREPEFAERYARAREEQGDNLAFETKKLADEAGLTHERIAKARLQIDQRKWMAGKLAPTKYGNNVSMDVKVRSGLLTEEQQLKAVQELIPQIAPILIDLGWVPPDDRAETE